MPRLRSRIPDPRPSRAHPEHRKLRKELEKEHGYGWVPPVILALLGVTLAYDVTKDVEKKEERHKKDEEDDEKRKRRRREREIRSGSRRHRRRDSEDEEGDDNDDEEDDYDSRDGDRDRRRRRSRRGERQQRWSVPDDIDIRNDYEGLGGGREAGMERAESLERGEVGDYDKMDGGLDRADMLERGDGGVVDDDRDRYERRRPPRRSIAYDEFEEDGRGQFRRRRYEEPDYEYLDYSRGRRVLDERRSRPRPRRRSSDW
ncbi:hypothetical protein N0V82_010045 [Gnomoniopsis sp. IMI 355080]|nr:hypothetical protein N0V82_010045 [Gnomoniopsis sp. IMI 355080]